MPNTKSRLIDDLESLGNGERLGLVYICVYIQQKGLTAIHCKALISLARPARFERATI